MKPPGTSGDRQRVDAPIPAEAVFEGMNEGLLILDEEDRVIHLNTAGSDLLLTSQSTAVGRPCETLFPDGAARLALSALVREAHQENVASAERLLLTPAGSWLDVRVVPSGNCLVVFLAPHDGPQHVRPFSAKDPDRSN